MKILTNLILIVTFALFLISCDKKGTVSSDNSEKTASFKIQMVSTNIPSEVFRIKGKLLRNGFDSLVTEFVIEEDYATADFGEIFAGEWLLSVTAFAEDNNAIYFGETMVNIQSNQNNVVNLHLDPVTGTLQVVVTWGDNIDDGLVAYYPFNGNANDESDFNNHGTVYGTSLTYDRFENENSAYYFDGYDDYIDIGNDNSLKPDFPLTISAWVNLTSLDTHCGILRNNADESKYYGAFMSVYTDGIVRISYGNGGNIGPYSRRTKTGTSVLETGNWYHIVGIIKNYDEIEIFVNGINDGGFYHGYALEMNYNQNSGCIGTHDNSMHNPPHYATAILDDIYLFNRALTREEVQALYNSSNF